jgi:ABC-2 type transport system permease protein
MNLTYIGIDLKRQFRDFGNLTFTVLMPVVMYLIFGASMSEGSLQAGNANVRFYVMASMAAYGASLTAVTIAGAAGVEQMQGWGRQIGLTPVRNAGIVGMKVVVSLVVTMFTIVAIYVTGLLTGAQADNFGIWAATFLITLAGAALYALLGYAIALRFKSESALGVATGLLVLMSFLGNVFLPLSGKMLTLAHYTPLYGYVGLVRWPQLEGTIIDSNGSSDSVWVLLANFVAWGIVFSVLAVNAVRKGRVRQ